MEDMCNEIRRVEACVFHLHSVVEFPKSFLINSLAGRFTMSFHCRFNVDPRSGIYDLGPTLLQRCNASTLAARIKWVTSEVR